MHHTINAITISKRIIIATIPEKLIFWKEGSPSNNPKINNSGSYDRDAHSDLISVWVPVKIFWLKVFKSHKFPYLDVEVP